MSTFHETGSKISAIHSLLEIITAYLIDASTPPIDAAQIETAAIALEAVREMAGALEREYYQNEAHFMKGEEVSE